MDGFPSGQREQTVNLPSQTSMVRIHPHPPNFAGMAELADAHGSGPCEGDFMQVQVLFPAPSWSKLYIACSNFFTLEFELQKTMLLPCFLLNLWHRNWLLYGMRVAKTNDTPEQENKVQQADYHNDANDCFLRNGEAFAFDNRKQSEACKKQNAKYGKKRKSSEKAYAIRSLHLENCLIF